MWTRGTLCSWTCFMFRYRLMRRHGGGWGFRKLLAEACGEQELGPDCRSAACSFQGALLLAPHTSSVGVRIDVGMCSWPSWGGLFLGLSDWEVVAGTASLCLAHYFKCTKTFLASILENKQILVRKSVHHITLTEGYSLKNLLCFYHQLTVETQTNHLIHLSYSFPLWDVGFAPDSPQVFFWLKKNISLSHSLTSFILSCSSSHSSLNIYLLNTL